MAQGHIIFCPIAHTHPIALHCELPTGWDYWGRYDRDMLARSAKLLVVKMGGWDTSSGIAGEIEIARELGLPIEYLSV